MTDTGTETRLVEVKGRTIVIKKLTEGQLLLLTRDARKLEDPKLTTRDKMNTAANVLDLFESTVRQDDDRAYVESLLRAGDLDLKDFLGFLNEFAEPEAEAKPVVRRGRPRKSVTK